MIVKDHFLKSCVENNTVEEYIFKTMFEILYQIWIKMFIEAVLSCRSNSDYEYKQKVSMEGFVLMSLQMQSRSSLICVLACMHMCVCCTSIFHLQGLQKSFYSLDFLSLWVDLGGSWFTLITLGGPLCLPKEDVWYQIFCCLKRPLFKKIFFYNMLWTLSQVLIPYIMLQYNLIWISNKL